MELAIEIDGATPGMRKRGCRFSFIMLALGPKALQCPGPSLRGRIVRHNCSAGTDRFGQTSGIACEHGYPAELSLRGDASPSLVAWPAGDQQDARSRIDRP